jgi:hypothetical protein
LFMLMRKCQTLFLLLQRGVHCVFGTLFLKKKY